MPSNTEENYLKAIYKITEETNSTVSTNAIAKAINTAPASVTDMLKKLADKALINYEKYKGVTLTKEGQREATQLVRKHRLWEVFLCKSLGFEWDEVHDIAEELEHIKSNKLIERLDEFLEFPKYDPHGDPIPDSEGNFENRPQIPLIDLETNEVGVIIGVKEHSKPFLKHLNALGIALGSEIKVIEKLEYDNSIQVIIDNKQKQFLTRKVSANLFISQK